MPASGHGPAIERVVEEVLRGEGFTKVEFEKLISRRPRVHCDVYAEGDGRKAVAEIKVVKTVIDVCEGVGQLLLYKHLVPDADLILIAICDIDVLKRVIVSEAIRSFLNKYGVRTIVLMESGEPDKYETINVVLGEPRERISIWRENEYIEGEVVGYSVRGGIVLRVSRKLVLLEP